MRLFAPGEWDDDIWWNGSVMPGKLRKEPVTLGEIENRRKNGAKLRGKGAFKSVELIPWQKKRRPAPAFTGRGARRRPLPRQESACAMSCMTACEMNTQTVSGSDHWVLVGDTYFCKHCDWNTEDYATLIEHYTAYHKEAEEDGSDAVSD